MKILNSIKMGSNENKSSSFSIATFNVHMWVDGSHVDNFDRVKCLIKVSEFSKPAKKILFFELIMVFENIRNLMQFYQILKIGT